MANKAIERTKKLEFMNKFLHLKVTDSNLKEYGLSRRSAYYWLKQVKDHLPEILENDKPGPKPKDEKHSPFLQGQ